MTTATLSAAPASPFDALAEIYDELFTDSLIGRTQRNAVWHHIDRFWKSGERVLELNCGTGEDAFHMAANGIHVTACDASAAMIDVASRRIISKSPSANVEFRTLSNEHLEQLSIERPFDGVLSNFSGLNCVQNLGTAARQLAALVRPNATLALCFSTRYCAWELLWYTLRREFKKSVRRWKGHTVACVGTEQVHVWYPTVRQVKQEFAPWFQIEEIVGIGTAIPPTYAEAWVRNHRTMFSTLHEIDRRVRRLPVVRVLGDHMLLRFRRCSA
jgi:2-polyprenyl-3-methyl-5-hydroxy-6-metoxy-1,4-benzoquinol methylase